MVCAAGVVNEENVADVQAEVVGPGEFAAPVTRVATKNSLHMSFSPVDNSLLI